ncbi:hypothetical protein HMPREF1991_01759 [Hoylesella loescheii DSM 19665 = JCM 12249 = ATCC 15930]|uniref:Uncharacterized protein n=1 Tax=Hoylesella loescheii DSM 19665 = JCM 12249 = ATCC 15930 TaxID=1122985 RepID=A0A069QJD8_HOYLO|nr:hypothetical protein HMPREF1991_01759 [Hoylesella loescheii DSM 19665 = JCM 12249 = ATCC 15930]
MLTNGLLAVVFSSNALVCHITFAKRLIVGMSSWSMRTVVQPFNA